MAGEVSNAVGPWPAADAAIVSANQPALGDYFTLLKPRVMSLVVFTAGAGMVAAPGAMHPVLAVVAIVLVAAGAGAAGVLNMWYDADIDGKMARTAGRPLPRGRIEAEEALMFGIVLALMSVLLLGMLIGWLAAGLLAFTIFFYAVIYTMGLKRSTVQNIVIGGAAGALPPVIGWAAAAGTVTLEPLALFAIIFLWTPPHFWALALVRTDDYARAGVPMLPNVAGVKTTCRHIVAYTLLMALVALAPVFLATSGALYGLTAIGLGAIFVVRAFALLYAEGRDQMRQRARACFSFSIVYLFMLFAAIIIESWMPGAYIAVPGISG